MKPEKTQVASL